VGCPYALLAGLYTGRITPQNGGAITNKRQLAREQKSQAEKLCVPSFPELKHSFLIDETRFDGNPDSFLTNDIRDLCPSESGHNLLTIDFDGILASIESFGHIESRLSVLVSFP
jgi:hypothetical protein